MILDWYILKSFFRPFLLSFFLLLLIFDLQLIWLYFDDLIGKGINPITIIELILYASCKTIPLVLPLSIFLATIYTIGNFSENLEIIAFKTAGSSMFRVLRSLIIANVGLAIVAFIFSNNIWPVAKLNLQSTLYSIYNSKPDLLIKEGQFSDGINGYTIKVGKKTEIPGEYKDVLIFQDKAINSFKDSPNDSRVFNREVHAEIGVISPNELTRNLNIKLKNGQITEEIEESALPKLKVPYSIVDFDELEFNISMTLNNLTQSNLKSINLEWFSLAQLIGVQDSLMIESKLAQSNFIEQYIRLHSLDSSELLQLSTIDFRDILNTEASHRMDPIISQSARFALSKKDTLIQSRILINQKVLLSFTCILFFFIAAALGVILNRNGIGSAVIITLGLFLIHYFLSQLGEKWVESESMPIFIGLWGPFLIFLIFAIILFYIANRDGKINFLKLRQTQIKTK
ncbi:MAG: lipopolysaccharide export system permease protein [Parvicellaceae bacterium]|jgi:lipopolysaccharide export system permease protein